MHSNDGKRKLREEKRAIKKKGSRQRRQFFKQSLRDHPEDAHLDDEYHFQHGTCSAKYNGLDLKKPYEPLNYVSERNSEGDHEQAMRVREVPPQGPIGPLPDLPTGVEVDGANKPQEGPGVQATAGHEHRQDDHEQHDHAGGGPDAPAPGPGEPAGGSA